MFRCFLFSTFNLFRHQTSGSWIKHGIKTKLIASYLCLDKYKNYKIYWNCFEFKTFQVVVNRAKGQGDLPELLKLRDVYGWTCLRWACRVDNLKVIKALIFHGADWVNDIDNEGRTLIHLVSTFGHAQILQYFLTLEMEQPEPLKVTRKKDTFGMTSLHVACFFGRVNTARLLVEKSPDLAHKLFCGINCLTIASWCISEDGEALIEIFREKLPLQTIEERQGDLLEFCSNKVYRINFKSFKNLEKEKEFIRKKYLPFIPVMVVMALFEFALRSVYQNLAVLMKLGKNSTWKLMKLKLNKFVIFSTNFCNEWKSWHLLLRIDLQKRLIKTSSQWSDKFHIESAWIAMP